MVGIADEIEMLVGRWMAQLCRSTAQRYQEEHAAIAAMREADSNRRPKANALDDGIEEGGGRSERGR